MTDYERFLILILMVFTILKFNQVLVFLLCFSIMSHQSYIEVAEKYIHEVRHYPDVPCILVGTKIDLRNDKEKKQRLMQQKKSIISHEEGEFMAKKLGCLAYFEISTMEGVGVEDLAKGILVAKAISTKPKKKKICHTQ
jgi:cell division control protein 42